MNSARVLVSQYRHAQHNAPEATYDGVGNRSSIRRDGELSQLTYDAADQLIGTDTGAEHTTYRYDPSGRLIEQSDPAGRRTLAYNAFGMPATMTFIQGNVTETRQFTYDGDDRLVLLSSTTEGSSGTPRTRAMRYRWSEIDTVPQLLEQREASQEGRNATCPNSGPEPEGGEYRADANFVYGYDRAFADSPCGTGTFARDVFGSTIQTGDTWRWAQSQEYDVFGGPKPNDADGSGAGQPPLDPRFGYRGELAMGTLMHLRARTYDTVVGRFVVRDPLATRAGQTDVVSPYAYANNSPTNFTDPFGEFPIPDGLLELIRGLLPAYTPGIPCPRVENTPEQKDKCFQGIILPTRGAFTGQEKALTGAWPELSKMWYARPSQGEKAAHAFTIDKLSEEYNSWCAWENLWGNNYGLNINVDWEVGPKSAGVKDRSDGVRIFTQEFFRIDIVTHETYIYQWEYKFLD